MLLGSNPPLHWEAWHWIKQWYRAAVDCAPLPPRVTLERITAERVELYSYILPWWANIPISVETFPVDNSVPTKDEIEGAVKRLRNHHFRVPSGIRSEHLKGRIAVARKKDKEETESGEDTTENNREGGATEATSTEASN